MGKTMELKESKKATMNRIYQQNGLSPDDIHTDKRGFKLIKREGIEKIIAKRNIQMNLELKLLNLGIPDAEDHVVVMATGKMGSVIIQDVGTANNKTCNKMQEGIMPEMAIKRAKSRVVLQLVGLYSEGYKGEDEPDIKSNVSINSIKNEN